MDIISNNYLPGDQRLIEQIVREVKSQGIFDQFRKECISDVDTKPAYQNLRQRVETSVSGFLTKQTWNSEMNKNQVREMLRKNIHDSGFLETGVERIVDQVVNPKITTVFLPKVEDIVYKFLGIKKPVKMEKDFSTPIKINTFQDLLPKDLEAISPELLDDKEIEVKDEIEDVNMEEDESPAFEVLNEKVFPEENSLDSQCSVISGLVSVDSNLSQKQDSLMSLNSSESRMSLVISENTPKMESEDISLTQKSSDSNLKFEIPVDEKKEIITESADIKKEEKKDSQTLAEQISNQVDGKTEKSVETSSKTNSNDKKRERHHSSSDKSKSRSEKDRDKSRSEKHRKEDKETPKEQKTDKEKYRIPKLSDKNKSDKESKSKDKDNKSKEKSDKERKSDKDKKSSRHSSDKDRSKSDDKNRKDSKSDKRDKERDDKRKDSSRSEKSKDDRKSSSSKSKESSSSKDKHKEKDKEAHNKKIKEETPEKKNGHSSSSSNNRKESSSSKHKKSEERSKSSHKKDEKSEREDKKKKRSSKDDHYSSRDKKNGRRSSDRDSDGPSNSKRISSTPQKNADKTPTQKSNQESSCSNVESTTGESGNSDKIEDQIQENIKNFQLGMQKIKLPKFASNLQQAMKIMKIRKQLKRLENSNKFNLDSLEVNKLLKDIAELSKDGKSGNKEEIKSEDEVGAVGRMEDVKGKDCPKPISLDINDFISSSNISMAKWNALEAKFMEEMGSIDYDSYESPYIDDEYDVDVVRNSYKTAKSDKTEHPEIKKIEPVISVENVEVEEALIKEEISESKIEEVKNEVQSEVVEDIVLECDVVTEVLEEKVDEEQVITEEILEDNVVSIEEIVNVEEACEISEVNSEKQNEIAYVLDDSNLEEFNGFNSSEVDNKVPKTPESFLRTLESPELQEQSNNLHDDTKCPNETPETLPVDNFNKKAVVLLEKHPLTEEMIKLKRNGEQLIDKNVTGDTREFLLTQNSLCMLENEKENLKVNDIVNVANTESTLENEAKTIKNNGKSHTVIQNLLDNHVVECEKQNEQISNTSEQSNAQNIVEIDKKLDVSDAKCSNTEDNVCKCLEAPQNERELTVFQYLIKSFRDDISESVENIKVINERKNVYGNRKRKFLPEKCYVSNNNLEDSASKRLRTKNSSVGAISRKTTPVSKKKATEEHTDIPVENKFSLPLSPAESEPSAERQTDAQVTITKTRRQSSVRSNNTKTLNEEEVTSPVKKSKLSAKTCGTKNNTKQRYASEDLYKPRMFLRRNAKHTTNS